MTIYVVMSGEQSDYGICGLFTVKGIAEKYVESHNNCRDIIAWIETYEADVIDVGGTWFFVNLYPDGRMYCGESDSDTIGEKTGVAERNGFCQVYTLASSPEKAKRIALDKFTAFAANKVGV